VCSPTFGIIGACSVSGHDGHLDAPKKSATASGAFVATFWGVFLANAFFLPMANKLKQSPRSGRAQMLIVEGIMKIQAGGAPCGKSC
jgi:chemotaxis protein MotA